MTGKAKSVMLVPSSSDKCSNAAAKKLLKKKSPNDSPNFTSCLLFFGQEVGEPFLDFHVS